MKVAGKDSPNWIWFGLTLRVGCVPSVNAKLRRLDVALDEGLRSQKATAVLRASNYERGENSW